MVNFYQLGIIVITILISAVNNTVNKRDLLLLTEEVKKQAVIRN